MPNPYIAFAQLDRTTGEWRQYRSRDDVMEREGYWQLRADGTVTYVNPLTDDPNNDNRFANDQTGPQRSRLQSAWDVAFGGSSWSPFEEHELGSMRLPDLSDGLNGSGGERSEELSPEMRRGMRATLKAYGLDGAAITPDSAPGILEWVQKVKLGMYDEEDLYDALWQSTVGDQATAGQDLNQKRQAFLALFSGDGIERASEALTRGAEAANEMAAGYGHAGDFATPLDNALQTPEQIAAEQRGGAGANPPAPPGAMPTDPRVNNVAGKPLASQAAAATTGAGIGGAKGAAGFGSAVPQVAGRGPNGTTVTPELLREFVDSDFMYSFNAMLNNFRDAGAASMFMDWLSGQMARYKGEYMGDIANQALGGQVPQGGFTSFLAKKGLMPAQYADDQGPAPQFAASMARKSGTSGGGTDALSALGMAPPPASDEPLIPGAGQAPGLTPNGLGAYDPVSILIGASS